MMIRAVVIGDDARILQFVERRIIGKTDGEGAHRMIEQAAHDGDHRRRINPSAEKSTERHVTDETNFHRFFEMLAQLCEIFRLG